MELKANRGAVDAASASHSSDLHSGARTVQGASESIAVRSPTAAPAPETNGCSTIIDPVVLRRARRDNLESQRLAVDHPGGNKKTLRKFYTQQNELIDHFLGAEDEERAAAEEDLRVRPKIKFAVYASFTVNLCLFIIQLYAAVSTGSLSVYHLSSPPPT